MSDVYILGIDMIKFGRFPDRSVPSLGAEAAKLALAELDTERERIQRHLLTVEERLRKQSRQSLDDLVDRLRK